MQQLNNSNNYADHTHQIRCNAQRTLLRDNDINHPLQVIRKWGGEIGKEINFSDIEEDVIKRLPTLRNKNFRIELWEQII